MIGALLKLAGVGFGVWLVALLIKGKFSTVLILLFIAAIVAGG